MTEIEALRDRLFGLESLIEELLPQIIAASPNRAALALQLREMADQETTPEQDRDQHYQAEIASALLETLGAH